MARAFDDRLKTTAQFQRATSRLLLWLWHRQPTLGSHSLIAAIWCCRRLLNRRYVLGSVRAFRPVAVGRALHVSLGRLCRRARWLKLRTSRTAIRIATQNTNSQAAA
jgi:hypothetical protein